MSWAARPHFLLDRRHPAGKPDGAVSLDVFSDLTAGRPWHTPGSGLPSLAVEMDETAVTFDVPADTPLRLEVAIDTVVDGRSCRSLEVVQLLRVAPSGAVAFQEHALTRYHVDLRPSGGANTVPGRKPFVHASGTPVFTGRHPLLTTDGRGQPRVLADFLDVTALWWDLHYRDTPVPQDTKAVSTWDFCPWYLDPACGGRPDGLRVLASTWGTPLLWFAVVPPSAERELPAGTKIGGAVFFRPVASAYAYASDAKKGLSTPVHAKTGMEHLAHYLLRGRNRVQAASVVHYSPRSAELYDFASGFHEPDKPVPKPSGRLPSLPIGVEDQLARSAARLLPAAKEQRVLFLPWPAAPSLDGAYANALLPGLAPHIGQALHLLAARGAIGGANQALAGRDGIAPMALGGASGALALDPLLWIAGYSLGGVAASRTVIANPADVSRFVSVDDGRLPASEDGLVNAARQAARAGRRLRALVVHSPYTGPPPYATLAALRSAGADAVLLPRGDYTAFWAAPPFTAPSWRQYVLADWDGAPDVVRTDVRENAGRYSAWHHEFAAYGGEIFTKEPQNAATRGFLEECFGP